MAQTYQALVHDRGPALWPEHKSLEEIQDLEATTPTLVWSGTYQGVPTPPGGFTFRRDWWLGRNRFELADPPTILAIYQSWDTGLKDNVDNAYTAGITAGLTADYRLAILDLYRRRLEFPDLPTKIERRAAGEIRKGGKLRGVIIEDKASGTSAYQTLRATASDEIARWLIPFMPTTDKLTRANQAAVWCQNNSVLLPQPGPLWLQDFEDELFDFPQAEFADQVDAFSQLILFLENYLATGYHKRKRLSP